jgi:alpha-D-ribose 1-methylphosphonate 5-triphosphate synthase subunit PhnH
MPAPAPNVDARCLADQAAFRAVMDAMAHPGRVNPLAARPTEWPAPLNAGAAAVALCLVDFETPVWLDEAAFDGAVAAWLRFHTGARITNDPREAAFAFITDTRSAPDFQAFAAGSLDYPDRSTTFILQVEAFGGSPTRILAGPGIAGTAAFSATPLPDDFDVRLTASHALAPRGDGRGRDEDEIDAALPRATRLVPMRG